MDNYRILLAGRNRSLIDHFFIQLDDDFDCMTTSTRPEDILNHIDTIRFDAFIYCIQKEDREDYPMMMGYKEKFARKGVTFIVAGHEDECDHFHDVTGQMAVYSYAIPIPMGDVMTAVREATRKRREAMAEVESRISNIRPAGMSTKSSLTQTTIPQNEAASANVAGQDGVNGQYEASLQGKTAASGTTGQSESVARNGANTRSESVAWNGANTQGGSDTHNGATDQNGSVTQNSTTDQNGSVTQNGTTTGDDPSVQDKQSSDEPRKRVLVIDDDPMVLKLIQGHLGEHYDVASAISGKVAYRFMASRSVDLILLDYEMPEENGPQVYENIRKMEGEIRNVPIVFLTGVTEREKLVKALSLKPNGYLPKPINGTKLVSTVSKLIG